MPKEAPLAVEVPSAERDKPTWVKVGVIAAVGFVVGFAWPRVMGVRLGPSAPGASAAAASAESQTTAASLRAPEATPAAVVAKAAEPAAAPEAATKAADPVAAPAKATDGAPSTKVAVARGRVLSCRASDGTKKTGKDCDAVALDAVVVPKLTKLAGCAGAGGQEGKLAVLVHADFQGGRLSHDFGKATTVPNREAITPCLTAALDEAKLGSKVAHEHVRYTLSYAVTLSPVSGAAGAAPPEEAAAKPGAAEDEAPLPAPKAKSLAAGEAEIVWEAALVRETPKTGEVIARLPQGSKVKLGPSKDGWYSIRFGENASREGWIYRGALGR